MRINIKNILCTTDFSRFSNLAISYALSMAGAFDAKLYVCHVIDLTTAGMYGEAFLAFDEQESRITSRALGELRATMGDRLPNWEPLVVSGHPADEISRLCEERKVDLVISATRGRSGFKRFLIGSVTGRLMRTLPCPLLVVQSIEEVPDVPRDQGFEMKRILVGCDFSEDSYLAFQYGVSLAQEFQAELHLAHVIEPSVYKDLLKPAPSVVEELREALRDALDEKLEGMVPDEALSWCTLKTTLLAGHPHEELVKYARLNKIDLIVLGIRGHGMVETLLIGSTTDRLTVRSPCPVLCVRPVAQGEE